MKNAYPIVMTQGKEFVVVFVPDFNINTQGKDIPDAIEMARDAIGLMGIDMQDDGEALPEASSIDVYKRQGITRSKRRTRRTRRLIPLKPPSRTIA